MKKNICALLFLLSIGAWSLVACFPNPLPQCLQDKDCSSLELCKQGFCKLETVKISDPPDGGTPENAPTTEKPIRDQGSECRLKAELCNGKDDNCNGKTDEGCPQEVALGFGGAGFDSGMSIDKDSKGNTFIAGTFGGGLGSKPENKITIGNNTFTSKGNYDAFLAKLDPKGKVLWAVSGGGSEDDRAEHMAVDKQGNVYIAGKSSRGPITFSGKTFDPISTPYREIFYVAKYSNSGQLQWLKRAGSIASPSLVKVKGIAVSQKSEVYVLGDYGSYQHAGQPVKSYTVKIGPYTARSQGSQDVFIVKLDSSGSYMWLKSFGGRGIDTANGIAVGPKGHVYVKGAFYEKIIFGQKSYKTKKAAHTAMFIAQLTEKGIVNWATTVEGYNWYNQWGNEEGNITVTPKGQIVISGGLLRSGVKDPKGIVYFGKFPLASKAASTTHSNIYIAKLSSQGQFTWATSVEGIGHSATRMVKANAKGEVFITGFFRGKVSFGKHTLQAKGSSPSFAGNDDIFVAKLSPQNVWEWALRAGAENHEQGNALVLNQDGVYITGNYKGLPGIGSKTLKTFGQRDIFVWKLPKQ